MADNYTPAVKKLLRQAGCRFERQGKGDHEIWYSPISERRLMVDAKIKSPPSPTASSPPGIKPRASARPLHAVVGRYAFVGRFRPSLPHRNDKRTENCGHRYGRYGVQAELSGRPEHHPTHP
jgi:hypothetical protein